MNAHLSFLHRYVPALNPRGVSSFSCTEPAAMNPTWFRSAASLDPAAALLSPRGQVMENGSARFFQRFAEGVFDEEDIVLADFVQSAAVKVWLRAANVTAVGYSNGANIAGAMLLLRPEAIRAAVLFRVMVTLARPPSATLSGKRVLICAGESDPIIPLENSQRLAALLEAAGAEVTLEIEQAGHGLIQEDLALAKRWLG